MKISQRISKEAHVKRMGDRATRRAEDASFLVASFPEMVEMDRLRDARRRNGVGRPPRKAT